MAALERRVTSPMTLHRKAIRWAARAALLVVAAAALYGLFVPTVHWANGPIWPWTTKDLAIGPAFLTILAYVAVVWGAVLAIWYLIKAAEL